MAAKKKKLIATAAAVATSAALLLGGTFAWQSISQTALNEASDIVNPGGRLHDDFNGENKDVYVENFAEDPIFARIRLEEYFEIITNYGREGAEKVHTLVGSTETADDDSVNVGTKADGSTYERIYAPYVFTEENAASGDAAVDAEGTAWWNWTTGGSTVYMPTYNVNKDSLMADLNGEYADAVGGISNRNDADDPQYLDYVEYADGETKTANELYDGDPNSLDEVQTQDELKDMIENGSELYPDNITIVDGVEHTAKPTLEGSLMSMEEWVAAGSQSGPYWVYDTDGWVYWAQAIEPGTATGLLLNGVELNQVMDDTWYYAINVIAQFVTADDVGKFDNTGFYDTGAGSVPTAEAETLLEAIGVNMSGEAGQPGEDEPQIYDLILTADGTNTVNATTADSFRISFDESGLTDERPADTTGVVVYQYNASIYSLRSAYVALDGSQYSYTDGILSLTDDTLTGTLQVMDLNGVLYGFIQLPDSSGGGSQQPADDTWKQEVDAITPGTTDTVEIDGVEWFVLAKEGEQALLAAAEPLEETRTSINCPGAYAYYIESYANSYLTSDQDTVAIVLDLDYDSPIEISSFKVSAPTIYGALTPNTIYLPDVHLSNGTLIYKTLSAAAFLPSAADFQSAGYSSKYAPADDTKQYTYGGALITEEMLSTMLANSQNGYITTRTAASHANEAYLEQLGEYYLDVYNFYKIVNNDGTYGLDRVYYTTPIELFPMVWVNYGGPSGGSEGPADQVTAVNAQAGYLTDDSVYLGYNQTAVYEFQSENGELTNKDVEWKIVGYAVGDDGEYEVAGHGMTIAANGDDAKTATITHSCTNAGSCACSDAEYFMVYADDIYSSNPVYLYTTTYTASLTLGDTYVVEDTDEAYIDITVNVRDNEGQPVTLSGNDISWSIVNKENSSHDVSHYLSSDGSGTARIVLNNIYRAWKLKVTASYTAPNGYVAEASQDIEMLSLTFTCPTEYEQGSVVTVTPKYTTYALNSPSPDLVHEYTTWSVVDDCGNDYSNNSEVLSVVDGVLNIDTSKLEQDCTALTITAYFSCPSRNGYSVRKTTTIKAAAPAYDLSISYAGDIAADEDGYVTLAAEEKATFTFANAGSQALTNADVTWTVKAYDEEGSLVEVEDYEDEVTPDHRMVWMEDAEAGSSINVYHNCEPGACKCDSSIVRYEVSLAVDSAADDDTAKAACATRLKHSAEGEYAAPTYSVYDETNSKSLASGAASGAEVYDVYPGATLLISSTDRGYSLDGLGSGSFSDDADMIAQYEETIEGFTDVSTGIAYVRFTVPDTMPAGTKIHIAQTCSDGDERYIDLYVTAQPGVMPVVDYIALYSEDYSSPVASYTGDVEGVDYQITGTSGTYSVAIPQGQTLSHFLIFEGTEQDGVVTYGGETSNISGSDSELTMTLNNAAPGYYQIMIDYEDDSVGEQRIEFYVTEE